MAISITKPTIGGSEGTWGQTINTALDTIVDAANGTTGTLAPDLTALKINGSTVTSTASDLTNAITGFVLEDGDGTEVTIAGGKEVKFVEGGGIDIDWTNTADYVFYDADVGMRFYTAGAEDMRLTDGGDLHVDGNIIGYSTTISDERLKHDINKIDNPLDKISQLNGYTFTFNHDGKEGAGVIAQEVEKIMPSAVQNTNLVFHPEKEGDDSAIVDFKTVQYDQLTGLLIEAIKALKAEIEELKNASA